MSTKQMIILTIFDLLQSTLLIFRFYRIIKWKLVFVFTPLWVGVALLVTCIIKEVREEREHMEYMKHTEELKDDEGNN